MLSKRDSSSITTQMIKHFTTDRSTQKEPRMRNERGDGEETISMKMARPMTLTSLKNSAKTNTLKTITLMMRPPHKMPFTSLLQIRKVGSH